MWQALEYLMCLKIIKGVLFPLETASLYRPMLCLPNILNMVLEDFKIPSHMNGDLLLFCVYVGGGVFVCLAI